MDGGDTTVVTQKTCGFRAATVLMLQVSFVFLQDQNVASNSIGLSDSA
jgi:hypothetical protein